MRLWYFSICVSFFFRCCSVFRHAIKALFNQLLNIQHIQLISNVRVVFKINSIKHKKSLVTSFCALCYGWSQIKINRWKHMCVCLAIDRLGSFSFHSFRFSLLNETDRERKTKWSNDAKWLNCDESFVKVWRSSYQFVCIGNIAAMQMNWFLVSWGLAWLRRIVLSIFNFVESYETVSGASCPHKICVFYDFLEISRTRTKCDNLTARSSNGCADKKK